MVRRAACACGALSLTCEGEPLRVSICHCLACQRRTGGPFGAQARWPRERVRIEGPAATWERIGDGGGRATFRFCPTCGSTVCWELDGMPGTIAVAVGAFADPDFPPPTASVYEARQHRWVRLPDTIVDHWD